MSTMPDIASEDEIAKRERMRAYSRKYYYANLERVREMKRIKSAAWRAANPEASREKGRANMERRRAVMPDVVREEHRRWREKNPGHSTPRVKSWREANPDRARQRDREGHCKKYGITPEQYDQMLAAQNRACFVCKEVKPETYKFHLDHNHATGQIRKFLCARCNMLVGIIENSPETVEAARRYIEEHST